MQSILLVIENLSGLSLRYQVCNSWFSVAGQTLLPNPKQSCSETATPSLSCGERVGVYSGTETSIPRVETQTRVAFSVAF